MILLKNAYKWDDCGMTMKYIGMIMEYPPVSSKVAGKSPNSMEVFDGVIFQRIFHWPSDFQRINYKMISKHCP